MKVKKLQKKLSITRITVANLDDMDMTHALGGAGGGTIEDPLCPEETQNGPYYCPSVQPYSTCVPGCSSIHPECVWPK